MSPDIDGRLQQIWSLASPQIALLPDDPENSRKTRPRSVVSFGLVLMDDQTLNRDRILKSALECRVELVAYARALLGDHSAAEDAVQEAMLVVVRKFEQFREGTSILAWCRSIVRLEILRMKQARQRERSLAERLLDDAVDAAFEESTVRSHDESENWRAALEHCLGQVTQRTRRLLHARCVEGLSYPQSVHEWEWR